MSSMVLLYQLFFILIIIGSSFFGLPIFLGVSLLSILFTLSNVFTIQLLVIQSSVIIVSFFIGLIIASFISVTRYLNEIQGDEKRKKKLLKLGLLAIISFIVYFFHYNIIIFVNSYKKLSLIIIIVSFIIVLLLSETLRNKLKSYSNKDAIFMILKRLPLILLAYMIYGLCWLLVFKLLDTFPFFNEVSTSLGGFMFAFLCFIIFTYIVGNLVEISNPFLFLALVYLNFKYLYLVASIYQMLIT